MRPTLLPQVFQPVLHMHTRAHKHTEMSGVFRLSGACEWTCPVLVPCSPPCWQSDLDEANSWCPQHSTSPPSCSLGWHFCTGHRARSERAHTLDNDTALLDRTGLPRVDHLLGSFSVFKEKLPGLLLIFNTRQPEERQTGQRQSEERHTGDRVTAARTDKQGGADLMGMSFISSLNMDGEMTGSQSLGSKGS